MNLVNIHIQIPNTVHIGAYSLTRHVDMAFIGGGILQRTLTVNLLAHVNIQLHLPVPRTASIHRLRGGNN